MTTTPIGGNWPIKLVTLLAIIGAGLLLRYLVPTLTFPLTRDARGELMPQIASAAYVSPRNGRAFDFTARIRSQCQAGAAGCVVACNNNLAGDPDFGQGKICEIRYRCGQGPTQTLRVAEGRQEGIRCDYAAAPSPQTSVEVRPEISSAVYASPRNGRAFDVTTWVRSQCQAGVAGCVVACNNSLAGDPDFGQEKFCEIHYGCGHGPTQTLRIPEGRRERILCH